MHSNCSDGSYAPAEVVRFAHEAGLVAMALADHDNIDGIDAAQAEGERLGVEVISAVELSVVWESLQDIHLLGYGFDHHHAELCAALQDFRGFRETRNERIVVRVNEKLVSEGRQPIDLELVKQKAGGTIGRPHIALALIEDGHVAGKDEAFIKYLVPCNVEKHFFPVAEAIDLIHRAGGVAVLAHPPFIPVERGELLSLFDAFVELGLDGIEAYNTGAKNDDIDWTITQARRRGLIATGGSDFHGIEGDQVQIGVGRGNLKIPDICVDEIRQALAKRRA
ncbi:MAG: PHP domain-containing protein [Desulfuromonadaceae bacterium]